MSFYQEHAQNLPIIYETDILVIGGGPAGVAAAVGAARQGEKTFLLERYGFLGGQATAGMSGAICGLFTSGKDKPIKQLVNGFAGEFYQLLKDRKAITEPFPFGDTALSIHDPLVWKEVADNLLIEAGVKILFHTLVTDVVIEKDHLVGVLIENKDGRSVIKAKRFIDATGDADICVKAGIPFTMGDNGKIQYPTMVFRMNQVDIPKALSHPVPQLEAWVDHANQAGYYLPRRHIYLLPSPRPNEVLCNVTAVLREEALPLDPAKTEDLTYAELKGRKIIREYERFLQNYVSGFEQARINDCATQIGIRQSRTIVGMGKLMNDDVLNARKSDRSVAKSAWCIEAHGSDGIFMFYFDDDYYDIPYDTLVPIKIDNLITAGRTICAEHEALASARVTAQCFLTGYAAGVASHLSLKNQTNYADVNVQTLRSIIEY